MPRVIVRDPKYGDLVPHFYSLGGNTKPDRFGNLKGFRASPPGKGANKSSVGIYFLTEDELASHLLANPTWGVRVTMPDAPASLRFRGKFVDGKAI